MTTEILLGFEIGTGERVILPLHHTVVTGMTQLSGKTTTLEALIHRGRITAITFLTKRGEIGFKGQREIQPYFKEQKQGDLIAWQYVEAILEATMGEKMKFERSWIVDSCKGSPKLGLVPAHDLEEAYKNMLKGQEDARRAIDQSVFTNLTAYFEIILPQIKAYKFAEKLDLRPGFNVMNLIGMKNEMQQLVIESVISYILAKLEHVVIVLPEAQKFIPEGKKTPVKGTAVRYIQEGAVLGNYMWFDTQVTTTVDKNLLKQCGNWIMGYQQERNEVASVRENVGKDLVQEEQITSLKLGHFMALLEKKIYHVYVLPAGVSEDIGRAVALGKMTVEEVRDRLKSGILEKAGDHGEGHYRIPIGEEKLEGWIAPQIQERISELEAKVEELKKRPTIEEFNQTSEEFKQTIRNQQDQLQATTKELENLRKESEILAQSYKQLFDEHKSIMVSLHAILQPILQPIVSNLNTVLEQRKLDEATVEQIVQKKVQDVIQGLSTKQRRRVEAIGETNIPWVNIWLSKVGKAEQKILRKMDEMYPLKMTKAQIAVKVGLSVKGGYFNEAFNNLIRWKLLKIEGDLFTLAEVPG